MSFELGLQGTALVSDALDMLGINGGLAGLTRISGSGKIHGQAFTLSFDAVTEGERAPAADFIDDVPAGSVIVIANAGRTYCTVWGDILAAVAVTKGIAGTVIDGCCRDVDEIREIGYSVWSRAGYMKSGKNRVRLAATQLPVEIGGTTVCPGDLICADGAGALAVPAARVAEVTEQAEQIAAIETLVRADLAAGVPLAQARAQRGYNNAALRTGAQAGARS